LVVHPAGFAPREPIVARAEFACDASGSEKLVHERKPFLELGLEETFDEFCANVGPLLKYPLKENEEREFKFEHRKVCPKPKVKGVGSDENMLINVAEYFCRTREDCDSHFDNFKEAVKALPQDGETVATLRVFCRKKS
jgi:hypothetical protein